MNAPAVAWSSELGELRHGDCLPWLAALPAGSVDLVVTDPPYGIGKAWWDTFDDRRAYVAWAEGWIADIDRVLTPQGTAYVMGFSEVLADLKWACGDRFAGIRWLVWAFRNRGNLRSDWGRSHESILHLRKDRRFTMEIDAVRVPYNAHTQRYPERAQGETSQFGGGGKSWRPHPLGAKPRDVIEVPLLNNGMGERTGHPTQKPEELIRRLVAASSKPGDLVVDPFGGSGTTGVVCELLGRRWALCEQTPEYIDMARARLDAVRSGDHTLADLQAAEAKMASNRRKVRG